LLAQLSAKYERRNPLLKAEDLAALAKYEFPGNVRELRNILERSLLKMADDARWLEIDQHWRGNSVTSPATSSESAAVEATATTRDLTPLEAQEYRLIETALRESKGGIRRSAAKLGLSPQALLRRLEKWPELRGAAAQ